MSKNKNYMKFCILIILCILIIIQLASADLRVVLTTPQVSFSGTEGQSFNYYIGVENKNSFPINILISNSESEIKFDDLPSFELQPNESREINYIIKPRPGVFTDFIPVSFSGNGSSFSLQQIIYFNISGSENTQVEDNPKTDTDSNSGSGSSTIQNNNSQEECVGECPVESGEDTADNQGIVNEVNPNPKGFKSLFSKYKIGLFALGICIFIFSIGVIKKRSKKKNEN